ncbi:CKLF-like MARVEL transmembrane domain-containing protein 8b [Paramormyrops kingsleyae]|uniref:CKLF-like MARVEL transmembrane domain containing 8a n=1 Tax=Paramormyrops kingsleyae TaxID=1676925 RepID=A0A3B3QN63_9TELE|nr:CKLF-like MARVEL transmembrane domain-containing protein 8 [Paramormyrops kingsleyae]
MSDSTRSSRVISPPSPEPGNLPGSAQLYDGRFTRTAPGRLTVAEIVFGLLVWMLIAGTDYSSVPALGWVMFIAVVCWLLTVFFFIMYLTSAYYRIPLVPWRTVALLFNGSGAVLYLVASILDATSLHRARRGQHTFHCWAASTGFAVLVTLCYVAHAFISFSAWKSGNHEHQQA